MKNRLLFFLGCLLFACINFSYGQCSVQAFWNNLDCSLNCSASASCNPSGQSPFTYSWSNGQTTQTATGLCNGTTYTVYLTDNNGCSSNDYVDIIPRSQVSSTVTTQPSCQTCCDGVVQINGSVDPTCLPVQQFWDNQLNFASTINNVCPGTHTVCIYDACGCQVCDSVNVSFLTSEEDHSATIHDLAIFPNPATDLFTLDFIGDEGGAVEVFDSMGRLVLTQTLKESAYFDISSLSNGLYTVRIAFGNNQSFKKLVISR
jgi:hypothetical protein